MLWGVIVLWIICCAASLSLPWPGIVLVLLLSCVVFFEFANPILWVGMTGRGGGTKDREAATAGEGIDVMPRGRRRSPSAALSHAFHLITERLRGGGCDDELGGLKMSETGAPGASRRLSAKANTKRLATFLKGSVGSFSRGGLMVTHEGRVIYKVNQDRGLISHPALNAARLAIFGVFDGHGENGELVAAYTMREVPRRLARHPDAVEDPTSALRDIFLEINSSLLGAGINALFGGCTAVVALVRGQRMWVANLGDSRAVVVGRGEDGAVVARGLTWDQKPNSDGERERIETMGGFVSDPEEAGASARVWLDETKTMVGLAMSRSIGDLAVERVGVIALPEVTEYHLTPQDEFLLLASDGVWEFIDNQEAAEVVHGLLEEGEDAAGACKGLMELANRRWSDMVGDYRDDITATVIHLPFLPSAAAAAAAAVDASADRYRESPRAGVVTEGAKPSLTSTTSAASSDDATASHERVDTASAQPQSTRAAQDSKTRGVGRGSAVGIPNAASGTGGSLAASPLLSAVTTVAAGTVAVAAAAAAAMTPEPVASVDVDGDDAMALNATPAATPEDENEDNNSDVDKDSRGGEGSIEETAEITRLLCAISEVMVAEPEVGGDANAAALASGLGAPTPTSASSPSRALPTVSTVTSSHPRIVKTQGDKHREGEEDDVDEEWEWEFGARENREPSREMREASREFPSGSLDTLAVGRVALES